MRLLNVHTFQLEEYFGDFGKDIPKYAILSHTWGNGEVTITDLQTPQGRLKIGWKKIEYACTEARSYGLNYAWIDTCCIDKTSSAELSEAINSMFLWYRESQICYAYLADVDRSRIDVDFARSRWFSRGWTLQELLAPTQVEFFDTNWLQLGSKNQLAPSISMVTGIDVEILHGTHIQLKNKSIACRMSWASCRQTTRIEDMAYSLLGIFDVSMPLLYGEGQRAFIRLQEEILKVSYDHSIFAWSFWPSPENAKFSTNSTASFGPLAENPDAFLNSRTISATKSITENSGQHTMTALGLQITLPVVRTDYGSFGLLGCRLQEQPKYCVGIALRYLDMVGGTSKLCTRPSMFQHPSNSHARWSTTLIPIEDAVRAEMKTIIIRGNHSENDTIDSVNTYDLEEEIYHPCIVVSMNNAAENVLSGPVAVMHSGTRRNSHGRDSYVLSMENLRSGWLILVYCLPARGSFGDKIIGVVSVLILRSQNMTNDTGEAKVLEIHPPRHLNRFSPKQEWLDWVNLNDVADRNKYKHSFGRLCSEMLQRKRYPLVWKRCRYTIILRGRSN